MQQLLHMKLAMGSFIIINNKTTRVETMSMALPAEYMKNGRDR
jgi:hypothetical protein